MDVFEAKIRGFHARAVENIMARTTGSLQLKTHDRNSQKSDNITTYLRKFEIDRENLNLAKRIILCESQHNHKKYQREWKKTKNFIRVRSNFKRSLCNQEPRLFKFSPITGKGNLLVTLHFKQFNPNILNFRNSKTYQLKIVSSTRPPITPTNSEFTLDTLHNRPMVFYASKKQKQITCKISQINENNIYEKGKIVINIEEECEKQFQILKQGKNIGSAVIQVCFHAKKSMRKKIGVLLSEDNVQGHRQESQETDNQHKQ